MSFKDRYAINELKAGAALNYVLIFLNALVGLLYTPYMLRMMGQSEYGLYSLVASIISYLTILDLGFGNAIIRYTAKYRAENRQEEQYEMFGMFFILYVFIGLLSVIIGSVLYFNVDSLFGHTMTDSELDKARIMMIILIFNLAFTFPMSLFGSILTAYEIFVFPRIINVARIVLNTIIMIVLLQYGFKAVAMVVVQTIFNVLTLIINYIYCKYKIGIKIYYRRFNWTFLKEVAIFSFWILLNVLLDKVYWSSGQFVLGAVSGTIAVSVFAVAIHFQGMYMTFSAAITSVFLPKVTTMVTKNSSDEELSNLFIRTGRIQYILMCFIICGFIVYGRPFIQLWAGQEYIDAFGITLILFIATLVPLIQNIGFTILQAKNQMRFRSVMYLIIALVVLFAEIIMSKKYGGMGCAMAIGGATLLGQGIVMNVYYKKKQKIDIYRFWIEILKMSIAPVLLVILSLFINQYYIIDSWKELLLGVVSFSIIYIPCVFFFSMNHSERELLLAPVRKLLHKY